jgi:DNA recombination protein RmuC
MDYALVVLVAVLLGLAGLVVLALIRHGELVGHLKQLHETSARAQGDLTRALNDRLDALGKRVGDSIDLSAEKTGKTMTDVHSRLAVIDAAQKNLAQLLDPVVELRDILDNKQARGAFGEEQLEAIVRDALPAGIYEFQATLSTRNRVDCLIRLPNPPGPIAIDAKFPLESYRALHAAPDDAARALAGRAFRDAMGKHIEDIASKYILPGETAESALMFLPSESVYAEVYGNFRGVVDTARRRRVWIVSPSTLMATLHTVRAVLKDARMREQADVIQKYVGLLLADVRRLSERVANLKSHFRMIEKDIGEIETSAQKIDRQAERIEEVQLEERAAAPQGGLRAPPPPPEGRLQAPPQAPPRAAASG